MKKVATTAPHAPLRVGSKRDETVSVAGIKGFHSKLVVHSRYHF